MSPKSLSEETLSIHWLNTVTALHVSILYEFQHVLIKKKVVILDHTNRVTLSRKHTISFFLPFIFHNYSGNFLSFSLFISIWIYISHWQNRRKLWDSFLSCFRNYLSWWITRSLPSEVKTWKQEESRSTWIMLSAE